MLYRESLASSRDDSELRAASAVRKKYSRTIVVDEREAASILDSVGTEGFIDPDHSIGDRNDNFAEHFDRNLTMSFER